MPPFARAWLIRSSTAFFELFAARDYFRAVGDPAMVAIDEALISEGVEFIGAHP